MRNLRREAFSGAMDTEPIVWHAVNKYREELVKLAAMMAIEKERPRGTTRYFHDLRSNFRDFVSGICRPHPILLDNLGIRLAKCESSIRNLLITYATTENGNEVITGIKAPPGWRNEEQMTLLAAALTHFEESKPYVNFTLLDQVVPELEHFLKTDDVPDISANMPDISQKDFGR